MKQLAYLPALQPAVQWEYQEFRIPDGDRVETLLNWLREGWEFVGFHAKLTTTREILSVAIMRREREDVAPEAQQA